MVQSVVSNQFLANGIPGEFSRSDNQKSRGAILNSAVEANNVVGRAVLTVAANDFEVGVAANGNFAGILSSPKTAIRPTLDAQAFIANETQAEVAECGYMFVTLAAVAAVGDFVYYSDTDGTLATAPPATTAPVGHSRVPGGLIKGLNVTAAGVGEIYFDISGSVDVTA